MILTLSKGRESPKIEDLNSSELPLISAGSAMAGIGLGVAVAIALWPDFFSGVGAGLMGKNN